MTVENMDFVVRPLPFYSPVNGAVRVDSDGRANIYINTQISPQAQKTALKHEIRHWELNHPFQTDKTIEECEEEVEEDPLLRYPVFASDGTMIFAKEA